MIRSQTFGPASDSLREFSRRRLVEFVGALVLAFSAALALALFTWSAQDPSLNHATDRRVHNALGLPGAVVADLLMQLVGVGGAVAALLPIAALGYRLVTHRFGERARLRLLLWFGGVACASAAASLLPVTDSWPLPTGLGGILGDAILSAPRHASGNNRLGPAIFELTSIAGAILMLTGAAGYGFESDQDLREEQRRLSQIAPAPARREPEPDDADDSAGEPGLAIIALGATLHWALAAKASLRRAVTAAARNMMRQATLLGLAKQKTQPLDAETVDAPERREPSFDETYAFEPRAPQRSRAVDADETPVARTRAVNQPAPAAAPPVAGARRVSRERSAVAAPLTYEYPAMELLAEPKKAGPSQKISQEALEQNARTLEGVLDDFSVRGEIINMRPGPVVTLYELEPAPGIKSSRVIGLADDIARSMSAISARVAVVPGRNAIGIELPNQRREMVYLRELLACEDFTATKHRASHRARQDDRRRAGHRRSRRACRICLSPARPARANRSPSTR